MQDLKEKQDFIAVDCDQLEWKTPRDHKGALLDQRYKTILTGGDGLPQVHITHYLPNFTHPRHRHADDEVLIIFEGEMSLEGKTYKAPSALYVARGRLYGPLTSGPEGAKFYRVAATNLAAPVLPEE